MAARPYWKGFLRFSLVSVPVYGVTANASGRGEIHLNLLHRECHSRIKYKKTCPIHGDVPNDEIVSGYEYSKDQYVIVDPEGRGDHVAWGCSDGDAEPPPGFEPGMADLQAEGAIAHH